MRPDLERLGLWDEDWARRRFLDTVDAQWIEHFYLDPAVQGQGIGSQVLRYVMDAHRDARPFRLAIDRGSAARWLYERVGFVHLYDDSNGVDQIFGAPGTAAVRP